MPDGHGLGIHLHVGTGDQDFDGYFPSENKLHQIWLILGSLVD